MHSYIHRHNHLSSTEEAQLKNYDMPAGLIFVDTLYEVIILWQWWNNKNKLSETQIFQGELKIWM